MRLHTMDDVYRTLDGYVPQNVGMFGNYNLDRMRALMDALGNPQDMVKVVQIAGSSGKTSTCYFIRALLQQAGRQTGLTVSPHVITVKERAQIDGTVLPDDEYIAYFSRCADLVRASGIKPTYFELLMAFAYWLFAEVQVDYAVVETGLGGLLDGSNVVTRADKLCVLADIGLDHTTILGRTLPEIAAQKAGIIQPGNHAVAQVQDKEVLEVFRRRAEKQHGSLELAGETATGADALPAFQQRNWRLACTAYHYLQQRDGLPELTPAQYAAAAQQVPPGRMEVFTVGRKTIILDSAHNPQKIKAFVETLADRGITSAPVLTTFLGAPGTKIIGNLRGLQPLATELLIPNCKVVQDMARTSVHGPIMAEKARAVGIANVRVQDSVRQAVDSLLALPGDVGVVVGSLYLVSLVRPLLLQAGAER